MLTIKENTRITMPARRHLFILWAIAVFVLATNLRGNAVPQPDAADAEHAVPARTEPANVPNSQIDVALGNGKILFKQTPPAKKTSKASVSRPEVSERKDSTTAPEKTASATPDSASAKRRYEPPRGNGKFVIVPIVRRTAVAAVEKTRKAAEYVATLESRKLDFDVIAKRTPYLPATGPVAIRFDAGAPFERSSSFGLAAYDKMLADKRSAAEAAQAAEARRRAEEEAARRASEAAKGPLPQPVAEPDHVTESKSTAQVASNYDDNSLRNRDIDAAALLQYFDTAKNKDDGRAQVSFVMPYQSAAPPLVMESKATYTETKEAPENKPAK
jgi:hypothetical protein